MQVELPSAVKEFYQCHDGSAGFHVAWVSGGSPLYFLSLKQMTSTWEGMCQIGKEFERDEQDFGTQEGPIKKNESTLDSDHRKSVRR
jgi:cell wall assembly regulator SMI1